jgi:hydrogenase nickel incorporation protein HypA/HybF
MHSLAMAQDILKAVLAEAEKNNMQHIKAINVRMEDEHFTEPDSLQFCLEAVTKGTIAEGAQIDIDLVERTAECPQCGLVFPFDHHFPICPGCGNQNLKLPEVEEPVQVTLKME